MKRIRSLVGIGASASLTLLSAHIGCAEDIVFGFYDDFESYTVGQKVPTSGDINTWDDEGADYGQTPPAERLVVNDRAHWGSQSWRIKYFRTEK